MLLPLFVAGTLLSLLLLPQRDPLIRFHAKQNEIYRRTLKEHGIAHVVCTPKERLELLAIGQELNHHVKAHFLLNTWDTYRRWLREFRSGKLPKRPGRNAKFSAEEIALVVRIAKENILSGFSKIAGEMLKLGISISKNSVKAILRKHNITPPNDKVSSTAGCWKRFVANVDSLVACDFLTKRVYSLFGSVDAYILVFIHLGSRRVWMSPSTLSPNDNWCRQQAIHAAMWIEDEGIDFRHLIRDNDKKFTQRFDDIFNSLSDADEPVVTTGIRMPKMNAFAESFISRFRAEALNHFMCFSLEQLDRIAFAYLNYHNTQRPHQGVGIGNRILLPDWKPPPPFGKVKRQKILGGLLNHYYRDIA